MLQWALPLNDLYWKPLKGHQGQDQGQQRPWALRPPCYSWPEVHDWDFGLNAEVCREILFLFILVHSMIFIFFIDSLYCLFLDALAPFTVTPVYVSPIII